jgi:hypothetical protein
VCDLAQDDAVLVTVDMDAAAGLARKLARDGAEAILVDQDRNQVYWHRGQFHPCEVGDEVCADLLSWRPKSQRAHLQLVVGAR